MKQMIAKYSGTCRGCGGAIQAGTEIAYAGRGQAYHVACFTSPTEGRSTYTRFSSGAEVFTNRRGRCEDAPCCGCCS